MYSLVRKLTVHLDISNPIYKQDTIMKKRYYLVTFLLAMVGYNSIAQNDDTKKADKYFDRLEYVNAVEEYKDIVEDGDATPYVYQRLADSYYNLYNTTESERYYAMYFEESADASEETYFRYAQMLKANGKYEESNEVMQNFASKYPNDKRAVAFKSNSNYLNDILNAKEKYTVTSLDFNTDLIDFGGYKKNGKVYFVSARNKSRRNYGWNEQPTLDIYVTAETEGMYEKPSLLEGEINTKFNEGTVAISNDGNTIYFTRNDYFDGDYEKDSNGIGQLKIFMASMVNGEWDDVQSLPFNDSEYSTGHPALSRDGKTLYFSSDMPGGMGQSDLYKVAVNDDGTFGDPINLGAGINTEGRESFPFIDSEGTLYFSSDGQPGIGGLDVFYASSEGNGFGKVKNIGQPINSMGDDFAFTFNVNDKKGYVSSNRGGVQENVANDNIYLVEEIIIEKINVLVTVIDTETGAPIADAEVINYKGENQIGRKMTSEDGKTQFNELLAGNDYTLQVNADDYESNSKLISKEEENEVEVVIQLTPIEPIIEEDEIVLNPIKFDFDKANIRPKAALELDRLVGVMKKHPKMIIKVEAHTDKRGPADYNQKLSERRAKSTVDYVVSQGVDKSRISWEAFGESKPKIDCQQCTEEEYQENRRSVFKIVER